MQVIDGPSELAVRTLLLDTQPTDYSTNRNETVDPVAEHIPGAVSTPTLANVQQPGYFLLTDDLAMRFTDLGVQPNSKVDIYCGSGI